MIYEVPHSDSEVVDVDKRSTGSSAASSQWVSSWSRPWTQLPAPDRSSCSVCLLQCQVPVYESFDYFEGLQMGGTK